MKTILVANPKGGCGKTTLATNLAGYFAGQGRRVALADLDRQGSAAGWLARRPRRAPPIQGWEGRDAGALDFDEPPEVVILDAPAGLHGERLKTAVKHVGEVLIPVQPSPFDMDATGDFIALLAEIKRIRKHKCAPAVIGNRIHRRTLALNRLQTFLDSLQLPLLGLIRDAQLYVQLAADGLTVFDPPAQRMAPYLDDWQGVIRWLQR